MNSPPPLILFAQLLLLGSSMMMGTLHAWTTSPVISPSLSRGNSCRSSSSSLGRMQAAASNNNDDDDTTPKLGIDLGSMLEPLSEQEAAELKAAATEIINDSIAEGIDEIEKLRERMRIEFERKRLSMAARSEQKAASESAKLLSKIDALTDAFLESNKDLRTSTKLAAAADQAMQGVGVDVGAWGRIGGADVATTGTLLGSVENAQQQLQKAKESGSKPQKGSLSGIGTMEDLSATTSTTDKAATVVPQNNRILVLADQKQDAYAKKLIPALTEELEKVLPSLQVDVYSPTMTLPIGGDNAACVLFFCTSLADKSSVYKACDRLLRKTLQPGGGVGQPPTQLVAISTLGTERTNKMPYSLQNLMGGKLDTRRQIEEAVINTVRQRVSEPALDFSICKFGELKDAVKEPFSMAPGDALDGTTAVDTAVTVLSQAIAFQPAARNATLSCIGQLAAATTSGNDELLDDAFLRLDGPELYRTELVSTSSEKTAAKNFEPLAEYMREWADLLATTGKGLTTPIRSQVVSMVGRGIPAGVAQVAGVKLLFLPTKTGKAYLSREEERRREQQGSSSSSSAAKQKNLQEGGIEVLVEMTKAGALRVRAKRCNYANDAVIKEISEETILSRLKDSLEVWLKDHQTS